MDLHTNKNTIIMCTNVIQWFMLCAKIFSGPGCVNCLLFLCTLLLAYSSVDYIAYQIHAICWYLFCVSSSLDDAKFSIPLSHALPHIWVTFLFLSVMQLQFLHCIFRRYAFCSLSFLLHIFLHLVSHNYHHIKTIEELICSDQIQNWI